MLKIGGIVVVLVVVQGLLAWLLLGVFASPEPHAVPVALIGKGPPVAGFNGALRAGGAFEVKRAADGHAARKLIAKREVYGAYAPLANVGRVLTASAASAPVAALLRTTTRKIDAKRGVKTIVTEVRPLPRDDATGVSAYFLAFVIAIVGVLAGWALELKAPRVRKGWKATLIRTGVLAVFSLIAGALLACIATQLGIYEDHFLEVGGAIALTTFGTALVSSVLTSVAGGTLGLIAGGGVFFVLGVIATSGGTSAPELLPDVWEQIGSVLPARSCIELIRNVAYFDGEAITTPLAILGGYAVGGLALMLALSPFRRKR